MFQLRSFPVTFHGLSAVSVRADAILVGEPQKIETEGIIRLGGNLIPVEGSLWVRRIEPLYACLMIQAGKCRSFRVPLFGGLLIPFGGQHGVFGTVETDAVILREKILGFQVALGGSFLQIDIHILRGKQIGIGSFGVAVGHQILGFRIAAFRQGFQKTLRFEVIFGLAQSFPCLIQPLCA